MSEEACAQTERILNITYYCLSYTQIEELVYLVERMCKSHSPMFNSTHRGANNNAVVINTWWLFQNMLMRMEQNTIQPIILSIFGLFFWCFWRSKLSKGQATVGSPATRGSSKCNSLPSYHPVTNGSTAKGSWYLS